MATDHVVTKEPQNVIIFCIQRTSQDNIQHRFSVAVVGFSSFPHLISLTTEENTSSTLMSSLAEASKYGIPKDDALRTSTCLIFLGAVTLIAD